MKADKMWEVFQSARNGSEKYLLCEGTPDDFYDREIMYLTATVLQQNLETKLPHLVLFHDGTNDLEMKLLDELRQFSHFPWSQCQVSIAERLQTFTYISDCETRSKVFFSLMKNSEKQKRRNFHVLQLITSTEMSSSTIHMPRLVSPSGKRGPSGNFRWTGVPGVLNAWLSLK